MKLLKHHVIFCVQLIFTFATLLGAANGLSRRPKSCGEIRIEERFPLHQKFATYPFGPEKESVNVLCDFVTDGGGWTVFQKRSSGPKSEFYRKWAEYDQGFGSVDGNYWLGLKTIQALTKNHDQELRVDLWDFEGYHVFAKYSSFFVSNSSDYYRLSVGGYSGTAGDSLTYSNGMRFSTKDMDNDKYSRVNCAERDKGAWWYNACSFSNLNGLYYEQRESEDPKPVTSGMFWFRWKNSYRSLRKVEMKIRKRR